MNELDVLMSVRNGEAYLQQTLDSILAQTYADFRFLIVDDGSEDKTTEILAKASASDNRVIIIRIEKPRGLAYALNKGLKQCLAPYIARMDGDDIALPTRFEKQLNFLGENENIDVVGSWIQSIDPDGNNIGKASRYPTDCRDIKKALFNNENPVAQPSVMIRRDTLTKVGGYREAFTYALDLDLWLRIAEIGEIANLPETLLLYRNHPKQVSNSIYQRFGAEMAAISAAERRARHHDPLETVTSPVKWQSYKPASDTDPIALLCYKFDIYDRLISRGKVTKTELDFALNSIKNPDQYGIINKRLHQYLIPKIAHACFRAGDFASGIDVIRYGLADHPGRFLKGMIN